ncbi:MAG: DUF2281 domain-containing protein [Candidatus Hatepunaea meridiana]|nr:DUF2281 domain-containing protein [Candidatus Hatepunaea meridiana]
MSTATIDKMELKEKISLLPEERVNEVKSFIDFILAQSEMIKQTPTNLRGIWKNKGFEKINDLDSELKDLRKEMNDSILKREF